MLVPKLKEPDPNPGVTINVLVCLGELAQVSGIAMRDYTPELLPLIIDMLQDSSSIQKREVSAVSVWVWVGMGVGSGSMCVGSGRVLCFCVYMCAFCVCVCVCVSVHVRVCT